MGRSLPIVYVSEAWFSLRFSLFACNPCLQGPRQENGVGERKENRLAPDGPGWGLSSLSFHLSALFLYLPHYILFLTFTFLLLCFFLLCPLLSL